MEHLTPETLARLVDEAPSETEAEHLAQCARCTAERDAYEEQTTALGSLADLRAPRGAWDTLEARLVSEGLVRRRSGLDLIGTTPGWMRVAAAAVLFLGGTGLGMTLAAAPGAPLALRGSDAVGAPFVRASRAATVDEAAEAVRLAEREFMDAMIRYRQLLDAQNGDEELGEPGAHYAALEYLTAAAQVAVQQAPADPFLNGLLASTLAEREAARREVLRRTGQDWY
jgi:hypothetical protein